MKSIEQKIWDAAKKRAGDKPAEVDKDGRHFADCPCANCEADAMEREFDSYDD